MPHPELESLTRGSKEAQVSAAISACIATEIRSGRDPEEAKGMCYGIARDKTGEKSAPKE